MRPTCFSGAWLLYCYSCFHEKITENTAYRKDTAMKTILLLAAGVLLLLLAASATGNLLLHKTYLFLDQHR